MSQEILAEPLLVEDPNRFVLFPIKHDDIWSLMKTIFESSDDIYSELESLTQNRRNGIINFIAVNTEREYVTDLLLNKDWSNF